MEKSLTKSWRKGDPVHRRNSNPDILEGVKSIAEFFGKSTSTIVRWILTDGLPASKTPSGVWITHKTLLLQWMYAGHLAEIKGRKNTTIVLEHVSGEAAIKVELAKAMGLDQDGGVLNKEEAEQSAHE